VDHEIERFERGIRRISPMHGLAAIADDHILHHAPHNIVEDCYAEKGEAVRPWNENRSEDDESDAGGAVEVFLEVKLIVITGGTAIDDGSWCRSDDVVRRGAALARSRFLARFARLARVAFRAEEMN
jgi:hypothetical protein